MNHVGVIVESWVTSLASRKWTRQPVTSFRQIEANRRIAHRTTGAKPRPRQNAVRQGRRTSAVPMPSPSAANPSVTLMQTTEAQEFERCPYPVAACPLKLG
jgi:hypothetical protein